MPARLDGEKKDGKTWKFIAIAVANNHVPERVRWWVAANPLPHETYYDVDGKAAGGAAGLRDRKDLARRLGNHLGLKPAVLFAAASM